MKRACPEEEQKEEKKVAVPKTIGGTKHIGANVGEIAEVCLIPGDPLRAKVIAETYLENPKLVQTVRNALGFTGTYKGKRISVMGTGMGQPTTAIYVTELITHYGVKNIIRVGSCGTVCYPRVKMGDLVLGIGAGTDSNMNRMRFCGHDHGATADFDLLSSAVQHAKEFSQTGDAAKKGYKHHVSRIFSTDIFYHPQERELYPLLKKYDYAGMEMEAAVLYVTAMEHKDKGVRALALATVSDELRMPEGYPQTGNIDFHEMSSEDRQTSMHFMMKVALETAAGSV